MPIFADPLFKALVSPLVHSLARLPAAVSSLLPCHCVLCGGPSAGALCADCDDHYFRFSATRCPQCGIAAPGCTGAINCAACLRRSPAFDATIVVTDYAPPVDQLVLALKFGRQLALAPALARLLKRAFDEAGATRPDMLIAVPLGSARLAERGFNQSLEIARTLSKALALPLEKRGLVRTRETLPQSLLPPNERRKNVKRAFSLDHRMLDKIRGRHVALVDDVMTTGETLHEAAATLKRFGAARITNFVFARA